MEVGAVSCCENLNCQHSFFPVSLKTESDTVVGPTTF